MEAKVTWKGKMRFDGVSESGFQLPMDASPEVGGEGQGVRPIEALAMSLAACTAMDVISILRKKQQQVTGFEVLAHIQRSGGIPSVFTHVTLEFVVTGHEVDPAAVERAVELSADKYCPVQAMLKPSMEIEHQIRILEAA
ncbi:MAG TPA: OsmC family protein [Anaerolineaceae bacterium]|nr:OsmC family protein [Anaerolineaceae bacterium]